MLFITNRIPEASLRSKAMRKWVFDLNVNTPSASIFFCQRLASGRYKELTSQPFLRSLKEHKARHIVLFIHGFSTSPEDAFTATKHMQKIVDQKHGKHFALLVPVIWPADAERPVISKYYTDRDAAKDSQSAFARALQIFQDWQLTSDCVDDRCRKPISIIAHSMGNRLLREALAYWQDEFLRRGVPRIFRVIAMTAADVVNECLEKNQSGQAIVDSAARVLVYYACDDLALRGSKVVNLDQVVSRRLGHTGPENLQHLPRHVYALDCSGFNNAWDNAFGHSYYHYDRKTGKRASPMLLHCLMVIDSLAVAEVDSNRQGELHP